MTLIIAAERPWNRKEKIHRNKNPKEAPQMLRRRLILVQADHGSWCEVHVPAYWLWLGKNEPNAGIRHAPSMRHISLVFNLARQARKKQMLLQDGKMASRILQFPATERRTHQANAADFSREGINQRETPPASSVVGVPVVSPLASSSQQHLLFDPSSARKGVTPSGI